MSQTPKHVLEKIREAKDKRLKGLDLSNWDASDQERLDHIPVEVFGLIQLERLNLDGNALTIIPDGIDRLQNLIFLDLKRNRLTALPNGIGRLKNLVRLDLSFNELESLPETIGHLSNLTILNLNFNQITSLPETIGDLSNLINLHLASNKLTTLPEVIGHLRSLIVFDLSDNHLNALPESISHLTLLSHFDVSGNPIKTPPPEIVFRGLKSIKDYFHQLTTVGQDYLYEAKLLIVGEGETGKTTLARKIIDPNYPLRDEVSTKGIEVMRWEFPLPPDLIKGPSGSANSPSPDHRTFRVNIWDFGGQAIYHATHQFFLTERSLYILVADTRKEDDDFYYWLSAVELLAGKSPLLIVKNEKQDRPREINEKQLRGEFFNLREVLATNLATNRGLLQVLSVIKHHMLRLPLVGVTLPKTWTRVRETLEQDSRNYISLEEYLEICERHGFTDLKDKLQLSGYLHDLGVCLHFQDDPILKRTVILYPEWGTAAVYKVLDNPTVIKNHGRFSRADLEHIWDEKQYAGVQDELLQLMIKFKLCYAIPGNADVYIAPQLLTENQPDYDWPEADNLRLRYTYGFMPKGILTQFIVATNPLIADDHYVWKSGVILTKDGAAAEVIEHYGKREITVRVAGKQRRALLTIVRWELEQIHNSYRRLKYDKWVPCNCNTCTSSREPHFYRFEDLREFADKQRPQIMCLKTGELVEVQGLLDDVMARKAAKAYDGRGKPEVVSTLERRLEWLQRRAAQHGSSTSVSILMEIEDTEAKLRALRDEKDGLRSSMF